MNNKYLINAGANDNNINKFINIPYVMYNANTGVVKFYSKTKNNNSQISIAKTWASGTVGNTNNICPYNPSKYASVNGEVPNNSTRYIIFTNYSSKEYQWNNYLVCIKTSGKNEICTLRADNYAMTGDGVNTGEYTNKITSSTTATDWDTFREDMDGARCKLMITNVDNIVDVVIHAMCPNGHTYIQQYNLNIADYQSNNKIYVQLLVDNAHIVVD